MLSNLRHKKIFKNFFCKGIDKRKIYAIIKVQKENNLQKMLDVNINKGSKLL